MYIKSPKKLWFYGNKKADVLKICKCYADPFTFMATTDSTLLNVTNLYDFSYRIKVYLWILI
jgi:hypothetical protein